MKYVEAVRGTVFTLPIILAAAVFLPFPIPLQGAELILTVGTFLFAILSGFYLSRMNGRYDTIRELITQEDAAFLAFYKTSQIYGEKFTSKIRHLLDQYYIISYDLNLSNQAYKQTAPFYLRMWDEVTKVKVSGAKSEAAYQNLLTQLTDLESVRNRISTISEERLGFGQWSMLILLAGLVLASIFFIDIDLAFFRAIFIILSTVMVLILLLLRDLQNFMLGGKFFAEESGQEVLECIGKQRYYNQHVVKAGLSTTPKHLTTYRLGQHLPGSKKFQIKLISGK